MANVLEGFLVRLGFDIDEDGMLRFQNKLGGVVSTISTIGKTATAVAAAASAAFIKTTRDVNEFYKTSNSTGTSIQGLKALGQAVERVGGNSAAVTASFANLASNIKTYGKNFEAFIESSGVQLYDQNGQLRDMSAVFIDLRNHLAEIAKVDPGMARMKAETLGLGEAFDDLMRKDFPAEFERAMKANNAFGDSLDRNSKRAHDFTNNSGRLWDSLATGAQTVAMDFMENTGIDKWLSDLVDSAEKAIPAAVNTLDAVTEQYVNGDRSVTKDVETFQTRRVLETVEVDAEENPELAALLGSYQEKHKGDRSFAENVSDKWGESKRDVYALMQAESPTAEAPSSYQKSAILEKFEDVRGFRNNNPGNLRSGAGQSGTDSGGYAQFASMLDGYKAMVRQISMYRNAGLENVASIISKWAPSNENDTRAYIQSVVASIQKDLGQGVSATSRLNLNDPKVMDSLIDAMIDHENGRGASDYFDGTAFSQALQEAMQTKQVSSVVSERDKIPSTVTVNQSITVNGAGDPMQTARTIQRQTSETVNRNAGSNIM